MINLYQIISRAVEEGLSYGWERRAWKYREKPLIYEDKEMVVDELSMIVMQYLGDVVDFEGELKENINVHNI